MRPETVGVATGARVRVETERLNGEGMPARLKARTRKKYVEFWLKLLMIVKFVDRLNNCGTGVEKSVTKSSLDWVTS